MTFNPIAALNAIECKKIIEKDNPNALDLGSQTPTLDNVFLKSMLENNKNLSLKQKENINNLSKVSQFTTENFYLSLEYSNYNSIDINGAYNSYKFDLNKNINKTHNFTKSFDLVVNNGTGEHVFDQHNFFLNFHNMTNKNGLMLNILPFVDWINHGFYNFNPIFFADLAASNNYKILKMSLANRNGAEITLNEEDYSILYEQIKPHKESSKFKKVLEIAKNKLGMNILLVVISKKLSEQEFKIPLQGKYLQDIANSKNDYNSQKAGSGLAKNQVADNYKRQ